MALTLLQLVQSVQGELGLPISTTVVGNPDNTTTQLFYLANRVNDMIRRENPDGWSSQQVEYNIVVPPPVITTGNISTASPAVISSIAANLTTAGVVANFWAVSGNSIPQAARVQTVNSSSQLTMDMEYTGTSNLTATPITIAQDTFPMPTDYDWTQNRTMWDRTNRWELLGPDSPQMDQWHRSGIVATGPRRHFRQLNPYANMWRIWPAPVEIVNPLQLVFEYMSINSIKTHGSSTAFSEFFVNDDDQSLMDDQALVMGIKWMFFQIKGFNIVSDRDYWNDYLQRQIARDGAAPTLNMVKRIHPIFISPANVQDGFFPGPIGPNTV